MKAPRVLFVHNHPSRFVRVDLELLRERYEVTELHVRRRPDDMLGSAAAVLTHDVVFVWFASWHALLPILVARLTGRRSVAVVGGYDTARMPEIGYGHQRGGVRRWISCAVMRWADALVVNSRYARDEAVREAGADEAKITVIYHGVDSEGLLLGESKEALALTVGNVDRVNLERKGLSAFVRAARHLPHVRFVVAGRWIDDAVDDLRREAGPNVTLTGHLTDGELLDYMRRAKVYVQASTHEAFGLAVAEAMLCGCIPVVSDRASLPEVVGGEGVRLRSTEAEMVAAGVSEALGAGVEEALGARARVVREFPLRLRGEKLAAVIEGTA